ncbi:hypothetical protein METBIDRAFT_42119 [Metschnikowia bicuspidata var. bicuspidata NRRL YB-4993]|uniref:Mitochondrial adapter protein MCP1 transmembrane domain-containing protein n=1 Tax=Metschnikowia bicuspidata var. bicuspidata NRRL YB-4993 TaxID=869754 RepID=A0A1A0HAB6_9ASCO|nr:hypothetical protein METBIDRAFT_42119 [Metschnikowia bicuspidata var. bicuspidata NRRL YB-4993]OBA20956.1 hypothetical protein METBIDRAFT_42119 [Metschnikowia bicuspidata var. bicuspidata NRRL YB-4993]
MSLLDLTQVVPQPLERAFTDPQPHAGEPSKKKRDLMRRVLLALQKAQKYSAYGFLAFFGLHVSSVVVAPALGFSAEKCQDLFEMTRAVYLSPLFEYSATYATAGVHVACGVSARVIRSVFAPPRKAPRAERDVVIKDQHRDDIGLGGLGSILGLGFKKSWVSSRFPSFTPLTFSGYVMAAALAYHLYKMKIGALLVDGDSALVNLNFVTHYLRQSFYGDAGKYFNYAMLGMLLWVSFYHTISGLFKYRRQTSLRARKIAYTVIGLFSGLSFLAVTRLRLWDLEAGFVGRQFARYLFVER